MLRQEKEWKENCKRQVMTAFARAEKKLKPNWKEIFTDVYYEMPLHITCVSSYLVHFQIFAFFSLFNFYLQKFTLSFLLHREQMKQMEEHVQKYAEHYPLKNFSKD